MADVSDPSFFSSHIIQARRFHLATKVPAGRELAVVCGGSERCTSDYRIQRRTFPYLALELVVAGRGELMIRGRRFALGPGTIFTYGPLIPHDIITHPEKRLVKYFVDFVGRGAIAALRAGSVLPGTVSHTSAPHEVMALFDELVRNGAKGSSYSQRICTAILEAILFKLAETRIPMGSNESKALETYQRCLQRMEEGALQIRTIEELCNDCGVNQAYLCRLFRRFGHETPYQFLLRLKMNHAASRLLEVGMLVKQVAAEMGFGDPYHFSRAFKSVVGMSPAQFVRLRRSDLPHADAEA